MNLTSGEIETRLKAMRSRIRRVQLIRAAMVVATVTLAGLFAMMAADWLFAPLPMALRWGMLGVWLMAVLAAARFGFGPMSQPISLLQVARWLEVRHPEMEERLSTVLELADASGGLVSLAGGRGRGGCRQSGCGDGSEIRADHPPLGPARDGTNSDVAARPRGVAGRDFAVVSAGGGSVFPDGKCGGWALRGEAGEPRSFGGRRGADRGGL